jgi:branched-chain amino acid transport system ATP-binding protein
MALLRTQNLTGFYGDFQALFGIDTELNDGETIAIIGANGAGKSTYLKSISGLVRNAPGSVLYRDAPIGAMQAADVVRLGIALVPEGRKLFPSLSVEENLLIGKYGRDVPGHWNLQRIYDLFPVLKERRTSPGTLLSGGQQQMVAIGRALMSNPHVLLCDEISLGLAPVIVRDLYAALGEIRKMGTGIVIVEQDIVQAMNVADRIYCFQEGRVSLAGKPADITREQIHLAYFGS